MKISVIFTTYNATDWLQRVLWGFHFQTDKDFDIVIADDGSKEDTSELIKAFQKETHISITHVWQADDGFQKCRILNKAIRAAKGDYLIMTDGDCIPRKDFVAVHRREAKPGHFLSGGYFKLPLDTSRAIRYDDIAKGRCFKKDWLLQNNLQHTSKLMKLTASGIKEKLLNRLTPTKRTWNGHNASCWKQDALLINGYDERMKYGGLDREFGERLMNAGIRGRQIRYSAICVHLDHPRSYANPTDLQNNRAIRKDVAKQKRCWTAYGITDQKTPEAAAHLPREFDVSRHPA